MLSPETNHNIRFGREDQNDIKYQVINISEFPEANAFLCNYDCWLMSDMAKDKPQYKVSFAYYKISVMMFEQQLFLIFSKTIEIFLIISTKCFTLYQTILVRIKL